MQVMISNLLGALQRMPILLDSLLGVTSNTRCSLNLFAARTLHEVSLHESIRYAPGDPVEKWLNDLLCLDCLSITRIISGCPLPETCDLYPYSNVVL